MASHLAQLLKRPESRLKTVISTHHTLFFNVLYNELNRGNASKYFINAADRRRNFSSAETGDTPVFQHVAALVDLYEGGP